jgi:hypothetical protein
MLPTKKDKQWVAHSKKAALLEILQWRQNRKKMMACGGNEFSNFLKHWDVRFCTRNELAYVAQDIH